MTTVIIVEAAVARSTAKLVAIIAAEHMRAPGRHSAGIASSLLARGIGFGASC
jgi:hypothetical protein